MDADFLLIKKMKHGDEASFDVFVRKYYEDILRYCANHCSDVKYAEDLTLETFIRFFSKLSDYRHMGKAKNYLYTIAGSLCKNYYKSRGVIQMANEYFAAADLLSESTEETVIDRVMLEWALHQLPSEQRRVIECYYFRGMKLREIAESLRIGLPLVKYRLKRGRSRMRELLLKEEVSYGNGQTDRKS